MADTMTTESRATGLPGLRGKNVLVTGGSSGIGQAIAVRFAEYGANVAINYLRQPEEARETEQQVHACSAKVRQMGVRDVLVGGDVSDEDDVVRMVGEAVDGLGGLDILVNNAGFQMARSQTLEETTTEELDRVFKTNLYALFWVTRAALPHLQKGASIINNSSIQAYQPSTSLLDYAATKAAINNFTVNLAAEVGERGIRVNAVAPGPVWTPLQPATQPPGKVDQFGGDTPLGRAAQPGEIAPAFVFLASPADASYVSATVIGVTGGKPVF
jgi:NAD(P)-dependent dehydrogenase (short-subunit alcohol dehydrogenase family)